MTLFKRIAGFVGAILFGAWTIADRALNWIGRSTAPEDLGLLMDEKMPQILSWLFSTPWWVPAILATALTVWLISPPRKQATTSNDGAIEAAREATSMISSGNNPKPILADIDEGGVYEGPHEELMLFVMSHLMTTCDHLYYIQHRMIERTVENPVLREFAISGITKSAYGFGSAFDRLGDMSVSPPIYIPFDEMKDCVDRIEKSYWRFADKANELARSEGTLLSSDDELCEVWKNWRAGHQAMVLAYDDIKKNSRMGKLFRPGRESRWGKLVPLNDVSIESQFLSPPDTGEGTQLRTHPG